MFDLSGKVAVITGGGSGIGLGIVHRFAAAGASVVIADIVDRSDLAEKRGAAYLPVDVSDENSVARLVEATVANHGGIDILVNNAGIALDELDESVLEAADDTYEKLFAVNAMGAAHGVKHAARHMKPGGSIVNVASLAGVLGFPGFPAYSMSKASVIGLTKAAAMELAEREIRVNAVCPGFVATPMAEGDSFDYAVFSESVVPMRRIGQPEDIAAAVHFLASDDASFITGQVLNVGGGLSAGVSAGVVAGAFGAD